MTSKLRTFNNLIYIHFISHVIVSIQSTVRLIKTTSTEIDTELVIHLL